MEKKDLLNCKYKNLKNINTGKVIEVFAIEQEQCFQTHDDLAYNKNIWKEAY